ncbi:conserved hypothetical protein [Talaromyces stipitatus ATCC 10500]|uniref:Uncharacterized protein n=1 Tax=Talaromyces stipitatus (strain ATCC 10500 / CBS 375.48 / QM 6759 / NRRL 1006) TaxID=441959 RepID=B8MLG1_TALSN|nr:uncharacterized protein TSTA_049310 [Talaromyces stipitatus ATCC 10500]EED15494.1 conserved hypothetical protein [Talaromyces stipitatus ATCC 10500]
MCFNLEAVLYLEQWLDAGEFIRAVSAIDSDNTRSIMADMILTSEKMPNDYVIRILQELCDSAKGINNNHPSFIRCIFDLCVHHRRSDIHLCEAILDQAQTTAQDMIFTGDNYPDEEIEYLSTKAFNFAVDLYLSNNQPDDQRRVRKAIDLSRSMRDDCGHLTLELQIKYEKWLTYSMDSE